MNEKANKAGATSGQNVPKSSNGAPTKSEDFVGRGGATERADFGGNAAKEANAFHTLRQDFGTFCPKVLAISAYKKEVLCTNRITR